jgi:hypothetical protein
VGNSRAALNGFAVRRCTTAQIQFARRAQTVNDVPEKTAILVLAESPLEIDAVGCISKSIRDARPDVRIITLDEFRHNVFYYGYPENQEESNKYFTLLANEPLLKERIAKLGLRYVVSLEGGTRQEGKPLIGAIGGQGAAVTWFGMAWTRQSHLEASIFDLEKLVDAGTIRSFAEGRPWFLCIGLGPMCAPIGAAAFTESTACTGLGQAVATLFTGGSLPESENSINKSTE